MTMTDEAVKSLLDGATPGRRVQFHGSYCPEAVGTPLSDWDTSHDVSVIRPDGSRYRLAHYKHASDAYLSQMAPDLARTVIALHAELADAQAAQAALRAEIDRLTRWRAEEGEKIKRQAKALTDLTKHCQRIEAENAGLARKIGKVQRGDGDHSQIADLEAKVINQRNELANLRARDGRLAELAVERDTLAAANSMLEAKVAGLRSAFRVNMLRFGPPGTSHEEIDAAIDAALATQEAGNG
jgi:predicted RNase H-like nuclease (RuvC/YqgF family)